MKNKVLVLAFGIVITGLFSIFSSCKKINDATLLGNDLIPAVDNVNTFDTTISNLETYNNLFTLGGSNPLEEDSTKIGSAAEHFVGYVGNDPLFGTTKCSLFIEMKPSNFPYTFDFKKIDSLVQFDSVVLVLGYTRTYGDTNTAINLNVKEISQASDFKFDTNYLIRSNTFTVVPATLSTNHSGTGTVPSSVSILPSTLNDSVKSFKDSSAINQLRIRLLNSFGMRLLGYDSATYSTDSAFRTKFKGFDISADPVGNAAIGIDLTNTSNTKLAFYYHYKNGPVADTTVVTYFNFGSLCAHANLIERNYSGSSLASYQGGASPDNLVFIQNTPGSYATIKIPNLQSVSNRTVHRAELIMEQVYDPSDKNFSVPDYLFLDAYDTAVQKYRTIPFDFIFDPTSGTLNTTNFGMIGKKTVDGSSNPITVWKFNITRYVQNYLTRKEPLFTLRLSAPFEANELYRAPTGVNTTTDITQSFNIDPLIVAGRVRLGGGNHATQKMRLRIIYSKL